MGTTALGSVYLATSLFLLFYTNFQPANAHFNVWSPGFFFPSVIVIWKRH